jgi:hypothetical protein
MTTIDVQIGFFGARYQLWLTDADRRYDCFGTIHLHDVGEDTGDTGAAYRNARLVLIQEQHAVWQSTRYQSGIDPCEHLGWANDHAIQGELVRRLLAE